jgi:hypothetical protein
MAPFKMLYGHTCPTLLFWNEMGRHKVFGPDVLQEAERQVRMVQGGLADFVVKTRVTWTIGEEN